MTLLDYEQDSRVLGRFFCQGNKAIFIFQEILEGKNRDQTLLLDRIRWQHSQDLMQNVSVLEICLQEYFTKD